MESHWVNEQEASYMWLRNPSASEEENVLDWLKSIGTGAAQGAAAGTAAVPGWGTLIGGLIGGGLGALQQATQQQPPPQRPSPPPAAPRPTPQPTSQPPAPAAPSPAVPASGNRDGAGAVQQFNQLLPQLVQLIQAIQPLVSSTSQGKGRAGEGDDGEADPESLAGDVVPDRDFIDEQEMESFHVEERDNEDIEPPEPLEPAPPRATGALPDTHLVPTALQTQLSEAPIQTFSSEWATEAESVAAGGLGFQWIG